MDTSTSDDKPELKTPLQRVLHEAGVDIAKYLAAGDVRQLLAIGEGLKLMATDPDTIAKDLDDRFASKFPGYPNGDARVDADADRPPNA